MAGLVAAAEARRLGATPVVFEKLERPGGSMRLSSGVVWRHRRFDRFRAECPGGDPLLQRLLFERLDYDLRWLESLGAPVAGRETGNELTTGVRFDPERLTGALVEAAGDVRAVHPARASCPTPRRWCSRRAASPPTASCCASTSRREADHVLVRAAPGSTGDGLRLGLAAGAATSAGLGDVYARAMPAPPARVDPAEFVALVAALRAPRGGDQRARRAPRDSDLVRGRHGPVDGAPAARPGLVPRVRGGAGRARARAQRG